MKPLQTHKRYDDIYTPPPPVIDLLPFLNPFNTIWECAAGKGHISKILRAHGKTVMETDIKKGQDFTTTMRNCDCIVTNPPYSKKDIFLKRCYELDKPFALLMPIGALSHGRKNGRHTLYKEHGISIIFLGYRVHFITPSGKKECWFDTAWFTRHLTTEPMIFL